MLKFLLFITWQETLTIMRQAFNWLTPLLFFMIVVCLFPLALGPDASLLNHVAPSIIWVAALLSILLSLSNLFKTDAQEGYLDLLLLSPYPLSLLVLCKILSHWLTTCLPLILISPVLGILLNLSAHEQFALVMSLLLGTPVLSLIGAIGSALTIGVKQSGLLLPILIMPLYIPVLIFGTATLSAASMGLPLNGYFAILSALILTSLAFAPLLTGAALRLGVHQ